MSIAIKYIRIAFLRLRCDLAQQHFPTSTRAVPPFIYTKNMNTFMNTCVGVCVQKGKRVEMLITHKSRTFRHTL